MAWVEWIGERDPSQHPHIVFQRMTNRLTRRQEQMIDRLAREANIRYDGVTGQELGPEHLEGLGRTIRWGHQHGSYIQDMSRREADTVLASPIGHQFRLASGPEDQQGPATWPALEKPLMTIHKVDERDFRSMEEFVEAEARERRDRRR